MGGVTALGNDWPTIRANLDAGRTGVRRMAEWDRYEGLHTRLAAPVADRTKADRYPRKKTRTIFTLLSVVVAFLLFGVLETVDYAFSHPSAGATGADKLVTTNKYSITLQLPFSDMQQIRSVPGVAEVTWMTWFGGYYQESKNFVFALPMKEPWPF